MDKKRAIERLDAIEKEAEELRKIVEKGDKIVYDDEKMYVAVYRGLAYILCGLRTADYFRWHSFEDHPTEQGKTDPSRTGQETIDDMVYAGGEIHTFTDFREGMKFFFEKYMELNV